MEEKRAINTMTDNESDLEHVKQERDKAYDERNKMLIQRLRYFDKLGINVGWKNDKDNPESDFIILFIPEQTNYDHGHIEQMGWHIHKDDVDLGQYDFLNKIEQEYDGHSTEEKYERLEALEKRLMRRTYTITDVDLISIVADVSASAGEIQSYGRIKGKGRKLNEKVSQGMKQCSEKLGNVSKKLREIHEDQYIR